MSPRAQADRKAARRADARRRPAPRSVPAKAAAEPVGLPAQLAINGGPRACAGPWPSRRLFGEEEKQAAVALFDRSIASGEPFGYHGEEETRYAEEFAAFMGGGYADGVNSGTNALYVALRALDLEPFTEVIVPPVTDMGGVMPVPLNNLIPVFADAAPGQFNAGPEQIEARLTERTSAIIVAHLAGLPCDMDPIMGLARSRGLPVIEDCAQTHGALYKGRMAGTFGDVSAFSTMFGKHHASGGQGGLVFTRREDLYWAARRAADRGKPLDPQNAAASRGMPGNVAAALNCNMDDLHAAIGRVQLRKLPAAIARRRETARALAEGCRRRLRAVRVLESLPGCEGSYWFLFLRLDARRLTADKAQFVAALHAEGLTPAGAHYAFFPSRQPWYRNRAVFGRSGYPWTCPLYRGNPDATYELPNAEASEAAHFRLMIHERWGEREVEMALAAMAKVEAAYAR
jgi:dTDP-4-amino-4,6-dideoxygalactose transaminase